MSTKQEALKLVVEAIRTAGVRTLPTDPHQWVWRRGAVPEALHKMQMQLESEEGGFEAASLIGCALRVFETGQRSEKSWKIVRLELDDARKKLEEAIQSDLLRKVPAEGLTLAGVLFAVAGDSKLAETEQELAKVRKELEALKAKKPDMGSFNEAWATVCTVLNARLPTWNDNKGFNSAQNASTAIIQVVNEAMLNRAKASAWDRVRQVLQETDDKWNKGPHDEPSNAENAISRMAHKAKDGEGAEEIWQLVYKALRQSPDLATDLPMKEAAPAAIKKLAEKARNWDAISEAMDKYYPKWRQNHVLEAEAAYVFISTGRDALEALKANLVAAIDKTIN